MTMNPDWLLKHFQQISEAPDAVPRLRRFILDLAVRGKLVEQNPDDELAAEVLKRIQANGDHGSNDGERKNQNLLPTIETGEIAFKIPENWVLTRVGKLLDIQYGKSLPVADRSVQGSVAVYGSNGVVGYCEATLAQEPAIIIGRKGSAGALNLCDGPSWTTDVAYFLIPPAFFNIRFLFVALQTLDLARLGKGVKPGLNRSEAYQLPIVVPPLAEQHRIVGKVDELMTLCDELEVTQAKRERRRDRLVAATLHGLNNGDGSPEPGTRPTFEGSARFYFNHLPRLTTRPEHIHQLRQTILNLAVRGKLVPQDPQDEPAEELLARVDGWRADAIRRKLIRVPRKPLKEIDPRETPYELPDGWAWTRLGKMIYIQSGDGLTAANMKSGDVPVYGGNGVNGYHDNFNVAEETIVIGRVGYYCGSVHVTPERAWVTDNAFITKFCSHEIFLEFLVLLLRNTNLKENENATAQPVISGSKIYPIVIGIPPLAEQHRIVGKVDELMALCDELEARITATATNRRQLLEATLVEALSGHCQLQQEQPHAS
jgi:type I restriction enzyme S subunit